MPRPEFVSAYLKGVGAGKSRDPTEGFDPLIGVVRRLPLWDGIGELALEGHEGPPVDPDLAINPMALHPSHAIRALFARDHDLLRVAAPQLARAPEWPVIDDSDFPARFAYPRACHLSGCSRADDYEIVGVRHNSQPSIG